MNYNYKCIKVYTKKQLKFPALNLRRFYELIVKQWSTPLYTLKISEH